MTLLLVIIAALAPVAVFLWYIYKKDSKRPEPTRWLMKAFGMGILSAFLAMILAGIIGIVTGSEIEGNMSIVDAILNAFCLAAIPEEIAKLLMLWLLLRKNPYFDEKLDGIVYAVCVGMGFAGFENILYLCNGLADGSWVGTGIARALFSIPGHGLFAVLMGYYYSKYHFGIDRSNKTKYMILGAPIIAHGIFDSILFSVNVNEYLSLVFMIAFIYFFNKLRKIGQARIEEMRKADEG